MAELQGRNHFFIQTISSRGKIVLMVKRPMAFWNTAIFSDESRFVLFSHSGRVWVWRLCNQEFDIKRLQPAVKHGGYSVVIWGAIWSDGHSELVECQSNITSVKYFSILQEGQRPIFSRGRMIKHESLFMEDGAPSDTSKIAQGWLHQNGIKTLCGQVNHQIWILLNTSGP